MLFQFRSKYSAFLFNRQYIKSDYLIKKNKLCSCHLIIKRISIHLFINKINLRFNDLKFALQ